MKNISKTTGTNSDGTTSDITTQVTWTSSNAAVAMVNSSGLVTGVGAGTATITATSGSISGNTTLTETAPISSTFPVGTNPSTIAIDASGNLWVANPGSDASPDNTVTKLSPSGARLGTFTVGNNPGGIAIDSAGNVWVSNFGSNTVTVWRGAATGPQFHPYPGPIWP